MTLLSILKHAWHHKYPPAHVRRLAEIVAQTRSSEATILYRRNRAAQLKPERRARIASWLPDILAGGRS